MPFLKKKIQLKNDPSNEDDDGSDLIKTEESFEASNSTKTGASSSVLVVKESILPQRQPRKTPPCPNGNSKNIVKNYGKALCSFASSKIGLPYLERIVLKEGWELVIIENFIGYIDSKKEDVNGIESLRKLLVKNEEDSEEIVIYKKLFKEISVIFMKYFSVNWIFSGRLVHKAAHLKCRFKILRRIQDPEHFTYMKSTNR